MEVTDKFYGMKPSINNHSFLDFIGNEDCLTIFFSGCEHNCVDCQNRELQRLGKVYEEIEYNEFVRIIEYVTNRLRTKNIVLQGGDPLHPQNRNFTKFLLDDLKDRYNICVYTGYEYDIIKDYIKNAYAVKCGKFDKNRFVKPEKTDDYLQLASTNQKIYKDGYCLTKNGRFYFD